MTTTKAGLIFFKIALTAIVVAWLLLKVDVHAVANTLRAFTLMAVAAGLALTFLQSFLAAIRWFLLMRHLKIPISFARALQIFWMGQFATVLLPGGVAGDGVRMWVLVRDGANAAASINSVIIDRAIALAGLFLLVAASMPFAGDHIAPAAVRYCFAALLVLGVAFGLGIGLGLHVFRRWQTFRLVRAMISLSNDLRDVWRSPRLALFLLVLSIVGIGTGVATIFVLIRSLGVGISFSDCLVLGPLIILLTTLPVSFGGWGIREGSMVGLFGLVGVPTEISLSTSILIGLALIVVSVPGALVWLQWRRSGATPLSPGVAAP